MKRDDFRNLPAYTWLGQSRREWYDSFDGARTVFNLLVKYQPWGNGRDTLPVERAFKYTDQPFVDRFKPGGQLDVTALSRLPALFVQETSGQLEQEARVGAITGLRNNGRDLVLDYTYEPGIPAVPNRILRRFAQDLDIADLEFSHTHWSVKGADLYRALLRNVQPRRPRPRVFQLAEFEDIEPKLVSSMMPFDLTFDAVYATLKAAAQTAGLRCRRADDIWENPAVMQDVVSLIDRSSVIICDCTGRNPNVFYEIGIAHALGREVILITQSESDIPFDLRHLRFLGYLNNDGGRAALRARLEPRLSELAQSS